jgi:hypothetical protein
MENLATDGNSLIRSFQVFVAFEIIQNNFWMRINNKKECYQIHMSENRLYCGTVKATAIKYNL